MVRWGLAVFAGLIGLAFVAWNVGRQANEPVSPSPTPSVASPTLAPSPEPLPTYESPTVGGTLVERERIVERDRSGNSDSPEIRVIVPSAHPSSSQAPRPSPSPRPKPTTQPPLVPKVTVPKVNIPKVKVPDVPKPPNLDVPLIP